MFTNATPPTRPTSPTRPRKLLRRTRATAFFHALSRILVGILVAGASLAQDSQSERDQRFAETMDGARLVGKFTVDGQQGTSAPQDDLYSISKLEKGEGDTWVFSYNMSYGGGQGITLPIPVRVVWADDTPMLTMSDQALPGLGSFTVRILIFENRYAGTWSAGTRGGHMWGTIEHEASPDESPEPAPASAAPPQP